MTTVLLAEDDAAIAEPLSRALQREGYAVEVATDGAAALERVRQGQVDLLVLDLGLPGMDGLEVCRRLREMNDVPVVMLTARDTTDDQVTGLDSGADDYLVKPFVKEELLARIRAVLRRRAPGEQPRTYQVSDLVLDDRAHRVYRRSREIDLTPREYELLLFFLRHAGEVLSQDRLLAAIWGYTGSKVLDVYVGYLRTKLEAEGESRLIHTVRGIGYVLRPS